MSHDRYFLENVANEMVEIDGAYEMGAARGRKLQHVSAGKESIDAQRNRQEALENRVRMESNGFAAVRKPAPPRQKRASTRRTG